MSTGAQFAITCSLQCHNVLCHKSNILTVIKVEKLMPLRKQTEGFCSPLQHLLKTRMYPLPWMVGNTIKFRLEIKRIRFSKRFSPRPLYIDVTLLFHSAKKSIS